ncbi:MAG TPA: glycosyltransferase family 2 protein [Ktedonobacteraceae bacterium]|nr:glycosyltransferase family 2 protein [Ktedonobacteraceae bacterium]
MIQQANDVSVIICTYSGDRWDDLIEAVESVQRQTLRPYQIIVVIDHNPCLLKRVQEHLPGVIAIENTEAPGLSGARNSGFAAAEGQIIAFLDDDAVATSQWLKFLCEGYIDPLVLGTGGAVIPRWVENKPAWMPEEFYWVIGCTYRGMPKSVHLIRNPIGANMSLRREVFETVGGFRTGVDSVGPRHAGACEETELCIRARQWWPQGAFLYQPQARVSHSVPGTRTSWRYFSWRCYVEGLAKADVAQYIGAKDGLSSERTYALRTLPLGILHSLGDALIRHDLTGLARAGAIMVGLALTTAGYLKGKLKTPVAKSKKTEVKEAVFDCKPESRQPVKAESQISRKT